MCTSKPSAPPPVAPPPVTETADEGAARESNRQSDLRRRRRALSRMQTKAGGQMQGAPGGGKTQLGQ